MFGFSLANIGFLGAASGPSIPTGLVNIWHLEETSSPAVDSIGGVNLTWSSGDSQVDGKIRYAYLPNLALPGPTGAAVSSSVYNVPAVTGYTIAFWFKFNLSASPSGILGNGDSSGANYEFIVKYSTSGFPQLTFEVSYTSGSASTFKPITPDTDWHLLICSVDYATGTIRMRLDDETANQSVVGSITPLTGSGNMTIGNAQRTFDATFTGAIDEVAIFDHALNPTEEDEIWNGGIGVTFRP